jgi:Fe2+ transport system protein B
MHILDIEDEKEVVQENFSKFQAMYRRIWEAEFKDTFAITETGTFEISHDDSTRRHLMSHINDNVFQNLNSKTISLRSYDEDKKFNKAALEPEKKQDIITEVLAESHEESAKKGEKPQEVQNREFGRAIDKILLAHRNTKFFLFVMSWQFFAVYYVFKKIMQGLFLYYLYKKRQAAALQ